MVHHVRFLLANKNSTLNFSVYPTPIQAATEVKQYHSDSLLSLHLMWRKMGIHRMLIYPPLSHGRAGYEARWQEPFPQAEHEALRAWLKQHPRHAGFGLNP